jgi:alkaline phosphatase
MVKIRDGLILFSIFSIIIVAMAIVNAATSDKNSASSSSPRVTVDWSADEDPKKWNDYAFNRIKDNLKKQMNFNLAKNILFFLGDGMGITTVTAGRIHKGQLKKQNGEEIVTEMENVEFTGLSKTYNIDAQTADSAGTATAYLTGVKARIGTIGVNGRAYDCKSSIGNHVDSIMQWAKKAGKVIHFY